MGELIFVGALVMLDWISGLLKGKKLNNFSSAQAIRKLWVSLGYLLSILVGRMVEVYLGINSDIIVKSLVAIIAVSEIQSLRENIEAITGIDILKNVSTIFKKKP